jgi:glycosyltransferase involved in cell wall biosynthesis
MPEVSVVIPAYNAEATLAETLASIQAQTFQDFEAIVVDDGSVDGTAELVRATADARIRVVCVDNGGVASARNHGIALARGQFVAFLDADDLWEAEKLDLQVDRLLRDPSAGICVTAATRVDADGVATGPMPLAPAADECQALLLGSMVLGCISSGTVRRSLLESVGGFDVRFGQCADWDMWLRISLQTHFACLEQSLVRYRVHGSNMSGDIGLLERDTFAVLDSFYAGAPAAAYAAIKDRVYSNHWMICSGSYLHAGKVPDALRCLIRGVQRDRGSIRRPLLLPQRWISRRLKSSAGAS